MRLLALLFLIQSFNEGSFNDEYSNRWDIISLEEGAWTKRGGRWMGAVSEDGAYVLSISCDPLWPDYTYLVLLTYTKEAGLVDLVQSEEPIVSFYLGVEQYRTRWLRGEETWSSVVAGLDSQGGIILALLHSSFLDSDGSFSLSLDGRYLFFPLENYSSSFVELMAGCTTGNSPR